MDLALRRVRGTAAIVAAVVVGALSGAAANPYVTAAAAPGRGVNCGEVVTHTVRLRADLHCSGDGIIVGADNITVDLNHHTVHGGATGTGVDTHGHNGVSIRHGAVHGFHQAILVSGSDHVTVARVTATAHAVGIAVERSHHVDLRRVRSNVDMNSVSDVRVIGGRLAGAGTRLVGAPRVSFVGVTIIGRLHGWSAAWMSFTRCRFVEAQTRFIDSPYARFVDNTLEDSAVEPIDSDALLFARNTLHHSSLHADGRSRGVVVRNNRFHGADTALSTGPDTPRLRVEGNLFEHNGFGIRGNVFTPVMTGVVVRHNVFRHNHVAGIYLTLRAGTPPEAQMTFAENVFHHNGHHSKGFLDSQGRTVNDGLHLDGLSGPGVVINDNRTRYNADYGIEIAPGAVQDGGGNSSTGDPSGCLGVTCT